MVDISLPVNQWDQWKAADQKFAVMCLESGKRAHTQWSMRSEIDREVGLKALFGRAEPVWFLKYTDYYIYRIYDIEGVLIEAKLEGRLGDGGNVFWQLGFAAETEAQLDRWVDRCEAAIPQLVATDPDTLDVKFWNNTPNGPQTTVRRLDIAHFAEVQQNYPADVRDKLDELMKMEEPGSDGLSGKLILLHGPPGCGKTWVIRALADAWRDWCDVECIIDPDALFQFAHYMVATLLSRDNRVDDRWRLIVIEDSGEFIINHGEGRAPQALARLLNLTDGLIGQGLKFIILMTTNEPFQDLNPAIARSGRCLGEIGFREFTAKEGREWLAYNGIEDTKLNEELTLSDLYRRAGAIQKVANEKVEYALPGYA